MDKLRIIHANGVSLPVAKINTAAGCRSAVHASRWRSVAMCLVNLDDLGVTRGHAYDSRRMRPSKTNK